MGLDIKKEADELVELHRNLCVFHSVVNYAESVIEHAIISVKGQIEVLELGGHLESEYFNESEILTKKKAILKELNSRL